MKKRSSDKFWIPFWVDKWLWGSMRIECTLDERAIWMDLLALAAKDDGYIRANEDIPYPIDQLAGMLRIPEDKLRKAINKFVRIKKLTRHKNKTLYVTEWDKYQFSESYLRVRRHRGKKNVTDKRDSDTNITEQNKTKQNSKEENNTQYEKEFNVFWDIYNFKVAKKDAFNAFKELCRKDVSFETIKEAVKGYANHLKNEREGGFDKKQMYPATFLRNEKWNDFIGVKYEPPL